MDNGYFSLRAFEFLIGTVSTAAKALDGVMSAFAAFYHPLH
jgi:hypothetical protein